MKRISKVIPILENDDFNNHWESIINQSIDFTNENNNNNQNNSYNNNNNNNNNKLNNQEKKKLNNNNENNSDDNDTENDDINSENSDNIDILEDDINISDLSNKINTLLIQMEDIRKKYIKESEIRKKLENTNKELLLKITDLEEDNVEYQEALKQKIEHTMLSKRVPISTNQRKQARRIPVETNKTKEQDIRLALIDENEDDVAIDIEDFTNTRSAFTILTRTLYKSMPFKRDIREIQATFGGAIAAYYNFFRWMIFNFVILGIIQIIFSTIHILNMLFRSDKSITSIFVGDSLLLPGFMQYSSFLPNESFLYTCNIIICTFTLTGLALRKIVVEDVLMKRSELIDGENDFSLSKDILCGWDNSLTHQTEVTDLYGLLAQTYREKLSELISVGVKKSRSNLKILELYSRRVCVSFVYLTIQFASYTSIVFLTVQSQTIKNGLKDVAFIKDLSSFIVPAAVTAINAITPWIYDQLTKLELWDSGQIQLNMLLFRMYLSNMMNLLILAISYSMLADPFLLADNDSYNLRKRVEQNYSNNFTCRMNQAASGMFSLILTEFFLNGIVFLASGALNIIINKYFFPSPKKEFSIAQRMVSLLYFVSLMTLTFPFAPLSVVFFPIMLSIRIKWEKYISLKFYIKPQSLWAPHKAGSFFSMFFLISLLIVAIPSSIYFLSRTTFPKNCLIQDNDIGLCSDDIQDDNDTCDLNVHSDYYKLYSKTSYCENYPACICDDACGPYIEYTNAFAPFRNSIKDIQGLDFIWEYIIQTSYGAWVISCLFYVIAKMRKNSIKVNLESYKEKEKGFESHILTLENDKKKHEKVIQRLKLIDGQVDQVNEVGNISSKS